MVDFTLNREYFANCSYQFHHFLGIQTCKIDILPSCVRKRVVFFLFFLSWWMFNIWVFESAFQTTGLFAGLYIPATKIKYSSFNCVIIILVLLLSCGFRIVYVPIFSSQKSMKIIEQCNRCGIVLGADLFLLTRFGLVVCVRVYVRMWHINGPINDHITTTSLFVLVLW